MLIVVPPTESTRSAVHQAGNPNATPTDSGVPFSMSSGDARFWLVAIAESSDDAIVGKDLNGVVKSWNKAAEQLFGFTADEIVGRSITCIIPPDRIDEEALILGRIRRNEKIVHFETERQRKDGLRFPVSLTVSPIRDEQNRIIGVSKIARDLTERDRREDKLRATNAELERLARHLVKERDRAEQASRTKSHFVAGMSHELRTPLNGILGYAQLLHMGGGLNATQRAQVEAMLTAGNHLLQMINCVLDLCEIESGHVEVQPVECDVHEIATACLGLVHPIAEAKGLALSLAITYGTRRQWVTDPMRLRQVLFNLLGNATKFTTKGAVELRLRAVGDGSTLRIEVMDTGPGIPADQRQRLFQEFERLDPNSMIEGAGIGLALSSRIAALIGGRLGHEDNPGGGSIFWLELPSINVVTSVPALAPIDGIVSSDPMPIGTLNVLVVDDVDMNRDIAASMLRSGGHSVICVESGAEAVAAVARADFDVVLMDVRMPEVDGLEATRRIRALGGKRGQVPIVAVTAQAFTDQVTKCRDAGMNSHVAKPFTRNELLDAAVGAVVLGEQQKSNSAQFKPAAPAAPAISSEPMILDPMAFDRTAAFLSTESVTGYLQTIANDAATLLYNLRKTDALTGTGDQLAETAHTLAGSAGLLGFQRLAASGRRFEQAIQSSAPDMSSSADALCAAIEATLETINGLSVPDAAERDRFSAQFRLGARDNGSRAAPGGGEHQAGAGQ